MDHKPTETEVTRARTHFAPEAIRDPTLYRVLAFQSASSLESSEESEQRRQTLESTLRKMRWIPEDHRIRPRSELELKDSMLWNDEWCERCEGWSTHRFARGTHETITLALGVTQEGQQPKSLEWTSEARRHWEIYFKSDTEWKSAVALPDEIGTAERPKLLGELWIWTGECEEEVDDWRVFGSARFPGGFIAFPWGALGQRRPDINDRTAFELFTSVGQREQRDSFLFTDLLIVFGEYMKVTQAISGEYHQIMRPRLNDLERQVLSAANKISQRETRNTLDAAENNVRRLNDLLFGMSGELWKLQYDARSATMAREPIEILFSRSEGTFVGSPHNPLILGKVDRIARQLNSDLTYFRTTEQSGRTALGAQQTLVEIENARGQDRLALVAIIVGSFIALGHVLDSLDENKTSFAIPHVGQVSLTLGFRLAILSVIVGCFIALLVWRWYRRGEPDLDD